MTPSPQGDLCVAKMVPPPGSRGPGGPGATFSDPGHSSDPNRDRSVRCEASRNLKWSITNTGIHAPVYKLTLPNPDAPGNEQPLFQISKPNPNANWWSLFYFTYAGHLIPPKRIEFGKIQKNSSSGGGGTRVTITGKSPEEKAVWQTLGEGNEDMVEWIVLCAALNVLDEEIIKAAEKSSGGGGAGGKTTTVPSSRPSALNGSRHAMTPSTSVPRNAGPAPLSKAPPTAYQGRVVDGARPQQQQQLPQQQAPPLPQGGPLRPPAGYPSRGPSPAGSGSAYSHSPSASPHAGPQVMRGMPQPQVQRPMQPPPPQGMPQGYPQQQQQGAPRGMPQPQVSRPPPPQVSRPPPPQMPQQGAYMQQQQPPAGYPAQAQQGRRF